MPKRKSFLQICRRRLSCLKITSPPSAAPRRSKTSKAGKQRAARTSGANPRASKSTRWRRTNRPWSATIHMATALLFLTATQVGSALRGAPQAICTEQILTLQGWTPTLNFHCTFDSITPNCISNIQRRSASAKLTCCYACEKVSRQPSSISTRSRACWCGWCATKSLHSASIPSKSITRIIAMSAACRCPSESPYPSQRAVPPFRLTVCSRMFQSTKPSFPDHFRENQSGEIEPRKIRAWYVTFPARVHLAARSWLYDERREGKKGEKSWCQYVFWGGRRGRAGPQRETKDGTLN